MSDLLRTIIMAWVLLILLLFVTSPLWAWMAFLYLCQPGIWVRALSLVVAITAIPCLAYVVDNALRAANPPNSQDP